MGYYEDYEFPNSRLLPFGARMFIVSETFYMNLKILSSIFTFASAIAYQLRSYRKRNKNFSYKYICLVGKMT